MKTRVAILGATSHIAKGLIYNFADKEKYSLSLFARNTDGVEKFLSVIEKPESARILQIQTFPDAEYDVVINCVGVGTPKNANTAGRDIIFITEQYDNLIIKYLEEHKDSLYINFSSGAAYGANFVKPVVAGYKNSIDINSIKPSDYYGIAKLHSETKHRAFSELNIVDLRVFSYFSRFVDLSAGYLVTDMINSIINKTAFITNNNNIIRDYVIPSDLFNLVECCIQKTSINTALDVYSKSPISKLEMIKSFEKQFGLTCKITEHFNYVNATGDKTNYYSKNIKAEEIGYTPSLTSEDGLISEISVILTR
jgi:nucleoside-diphosphate-sugar epimerase